MVCLGLTEACEVHTVAAVKKTRLTYTIQGAGLASPISALFFVFTWNWLFFLLIPIGAVAGFVAGSLLTGRSSTVVVQRTAGNRRLRCTVHRVALIARLLRHDSVIIRFVSLLAIGCALFVLAWLVGYTLLPEGALHAGAQAHMARGALTSPSQAVWDEWLKILRANLIPILIIILGSMLIKINGFSLGYLVALYNTTLYGLFVGTNSFAIPYAERMAPSLGILRRSGPYEMTALILLAAAAFPWAFLEVKRLFRTTPQLVIPAPRFRLADVVALAAGVGLMMAANWLEASMIVLQLP